MRGNSIAKVASVGFFNKVADFGIGIAAEFVAPHSSGLGKVLDVNRCVRHLIITRRYVGGRCARGAPCVAQRRYNPVPQGLALTSHRFS